MQLFISTTYVLSKLEGTFNCVASDEEVKGIKVHTQLASWS